MNEIKYGYTDMPYMAGVAAQLEQQTLNALRAIADTAHILEAQGVIDNVYALVRQKANASALKYTTTQMHDVIEQSNREYHALNAVRAELRAMVEEEELNDRIGLALFLNSVGQLRTEGIYEYMRSTVNPNASNAQIDAAITRYNAIFTHE